MGHLTKLPTELLQEILVYSASSNLVEACKALSRCFLPSSHISGAIKARFLVARATQLLWEKALANISSSNSRGASKAVGYAQIRKQIRSKQGTLAKENLQAVPPLTLHQVLSTALVISVRYAILDINVLRILDRALGKVKGTGSPSTELRMPDSYGGRIHQWLVNRVVEERQRNLQRLAAKRKSGASPKETSMPPRRPYFELLESLLRRGLLQDNGYALLMSVTNNHTDMVRLLLEHGFDPQIRENRAAFFAVKKRNIEILELLLKKGARPQATAVCEAIRQCDSGLDDVVRLLLRSSAPVDDEVLCLAIKLQGKVPLQGLRELLDVARQNNHTPGRTVMELASNSNHAAAVVPMLLEFGGVPDMKLLRSLIK